MCTAKALQPILRRSEREHADCIDGCLCLWYLCDRWQCLFTGTTFWSRVDSFQLSDDLPNPSPKVSGTSACRRDLDQQEGHAGMGPQAYSPDGSSNDPMQPAPPGTEQWASFGIYPSITPLLHTCEQSYVALSA